MTELNPENADQLLTQADTILQCTDAMLSLFDSDYELIYANRAANDTFGTEPRSLVLRLANDNDIHMITSALDEADKYRVEMEMRTVNGARWHYMDIQRIHDTALGNYNLLVTATDCTDRRYAQQLAHKLAYTDALTGLPNRSALIRFTEALLGNIEESTTFALLFMDLDRFKVVNDSLGHAVGDKLLIEVAHRLKRAVGSKGMISRIGGDEFVAILCNQSDPQQLRDIANSILHTMADPVTLSQQKLRVVPSIGICCYPKDGNTMAELMEKADAAMYLAKAHQNNFCFYDEQMASSVHNSVKDRMRLENDMLYAVDNHEFELYFQPKISCADLRVSGVEALIRWNHPTRGMVPPDKFIGIAEETGQIIELGDWVLKAAMKQQRLWQEQGLEIPVSINISARQFGAENLVRTITEILQQTGCTPAMVQLEITESMLLGDVDKVNLTLTQLSAMGIRLALDDFGTGYSNLAYLQQYPLDILKIDRAFLADQKRSMLMETILAMGKVLGLTIVAEGVETASQADWLIAHGCDQMQGFYFSRPLPVIAATEFLYDDKSKDGDALHHAA